jgi:hypothetical protein
MRLSSRFVLDSLFLPAAAWVVVASLKWSAGTAHWTAFGVSVGIAVLAAASAALSRRAGRKAGHGVVSLFALWSLIAALVFSGPVLTWLMFADAVAVGVLALADLTAHEAGTEKAVRRLVVHEGAQEVPADTAGRRVAA